MRGMMTGVIPLADGEARTLQADGAAFLSVITDATGEATISRVDSNNAAEHTAGANNQISVAAEAIETIPVDWPYYRISVAGGSARVALVSQ